MMSMRKALAVSCLLGVVVFGYVTITAPMIAATAPAILTVALAAAGWWLWPKKDDADKRSWPEV